MDELLELIATAMSAAVVVTAFYALLGSGLGIIGAAVGGAFTCAVNIAPVAACGGAVAYAASRTGYGGLE